MRDFLKALAVLVGTIIGVGIFALPYLASKAGFFITIFSFLIISFVVIAVYLIFAQVCLGTKTTHRLPGYVEKYLGSNWKIFSFLIIICGMVGACLAYLVVGGEFLKFLFNSYLGENNLAYSLIFFFLASFLIFRDIKAISQIELFLVFVLLFILFIFFFKALPFIDLNYFKTINWHYLFLPYGVIIFSLWGSSVIPEIKEMLQGDEQKLRKVIYSAMTISVLAYLFFIFIIFGACGGSTSQEAISGFVTRVGDGIIKFGFLFGVIACFTSFLTLGLTLKKVFWYDFGLSKNLSWFIACFLPLFLFLIGIQQFINIIGLTGALAVGSECIIIVFLYRAFLKKKYKKKMNPLLYLLPVLFILGIVCQLIYFCL